MMKMMVLFRPTILLYGISIITLCSGFFFKQQNNVRVQSRITRVGLVQLPGEEANENSLPRLSPNRKDLIRWIDSSGGSFSPNIVSDINGWSLVARTVAKENDILATIPKSICITSAIVTSAQPESLLLESAQTLMKSLSPKLWRARLAVAVLSERVRPHSPFMTYIRNLPHIYRGIPIFYYSKEFDEIQDLSLMMTTKERCRFLLEFVEKVLASNPRSNAHPFNGFSPDINAFGWAFATASTRALRNPDVVNEDGPTLVPGIDFASHSFSPNCEVIATEENYFLIAKKDVAIGEALTINYGEFSNAQLLADYGFSMDVNPYDLIKLKCEPMLINTARVVMNLGAFSNDEYIQRLGRAEQANVPPLNTRGLVSVSGQTVNVHPPGYALIGRGAYALDEKWLHSWQKRWLDLLDLYGSRGTKAVNIGGSKLTDIDGKLWAYLRIVYSDRESDITRHGFDPFILQRVSSVTSIEVEQQVVRTLIGIFAVLLHGFETDWQSDFDALTQGDLSIAKRGGGARDTIADAQAYIRQAQQTLRKRKTQLSDQISVTVPAIDCINVMADRNNGSDDVVDEKFNWNIQELLKFRIRRKRSLVELIDNLMIHFERLSPDASLVSSEDKFGRRAKIKDLMEEITKRGTGGYEDTVAAAAKLSDSWAEKDMSL